MTHDLQGRSEPGGRSVALVTGGGRGRGAAIVRGLASLGHAVAIHCHASLAAARGLAAEVEAEGGRALAVTANFRDEGAVRALVHRVADHFGRLDVVVSTARLRRFAPLETLSALDLAAHHDVDVVAALVVAQEAAAVMGQQPQGGTIVALADGGEPQPGLLPSFTSQAAIPALVRALAVELAARQPRVRVACLVDESPPASEERVVAAVLRGLAAPVPGGGTIRLD